MTSPGVLSLQSSIEKELEAIAKSSVEKELRDEIELLKDERASGFPDEDNFLGILMDFHKHPEEIKKHVAIAEADRVMYDKSFFKEFFKSIQEQLTEDVVRKANVIIIRYNEAEIIHLDFHRLGSEEPIMTEIPYGFQLNGEEVSLYEVGKTSIVLVDFYGHPIDTGEVFTSISNDFFYSVMGLRKLRILQSVYRKTRDFLESHYEMKGYQYFIGDYNEGLWIE